MPHDGSAPAPAIQPDWHPEQTGPSFRDLIRSEFDLRMQELGLFGLIRIWLARWWPMKDEDD